MPMQQNRPKKEKGTPQEPVYVDDIFPPGEEEQEDNWEIPGRVELVEDKNPEVKLEDVSEDIEAEDEENIPAQPSKPVSNLQKYRVKTPSPSSRRLPDDHRYSTYKPLPNNLPSPPRRDGRNEARTGSWPVDPEVKQNGSPQTKHGVSHPMRPEKTFQREQRTSKERANSEEKSSSSDQKQSGKFIPPLPIPEIPPRSADKESPPAPPPVLPVMPVKSSSAPKQVFPVEEEHSSYPSREQKPLNGSSFHPLIDEDSTASENDETTLETGRDRIDSSLKEANLHDLIERLQLPENSLILGICSDGLPLVLELSDPSPGALLFLGDDVEGLRGHLHAVLASICLLSDPKQVQVDVISPQPETFATQKLFPHVQKVHLVDQDEMFDLLGCLFELIEQRKRKDNSLTGKLFSGIIPSNKGPVRILMIDQVDRLVEHLAPESLAYLRWLIRRGPAAGVWVFASLNGQNTQNLDRKTIKSFGLQVAGKLMDSHQTAWLTDVPLETLSSLEPGEACLKLDEEVISFSILKI